MRLEAILSRRRLRLNPYMFSDDELIAMAYDSGWGDLTDIVDMVIMRFTRLRETGTIERFDGVYTCVGRSDEEIFIPLGALKWGVFASDSLRTERSWIGKKAITNDADVEKLVGKTVFVSRVIRGHALGGKSRVAYRMHRLKGKPVVDAKIIREAMCDAKIEMLKRIIDYPQGPFNLSCHKNMIDYEPRLRRAIAIVRDYVQSRRMS